MKFLVTTSAFIAGAVVDDETRMVITADPGLLHLRGCNETEFREHCREKKWALQQVE